MNDRGVPKVITMTKAARCLFLLVFMLVGGGLARANQINLLCSTVGPGNSEHATIACPQFSADGVLTLVTITLTGSLDGSITLNNTDLTAAMGQGSMSAMFTFGPLLGFQVPLVGLTATASTGNQNVPGKGSDTTPVNSGKVSTTDTNSSNVSSYKGSGSFPVGVDTQSTSTISGGGSLGGTLSAQTTASAAVMYTYSPGVPSGSAPQEPLMPIDLVTGASTGAPSGSAPQEPLMPIDPVTTASTVPEPQTWLLAGPLDRRRVLRYIRGMNRRTCLKAVAWAGAGVALPAASAEPVQLHVDLDVDPAREQELLTNFRSRFRPAISRQPGFVEVRLLKLDTVLEGQAPANTSYRLIISFHTEEQRKAWVATAVHQKVWPTIVGTLRGGRFSAVLFRPA
jgi:heme-degrading monooxygenase HmoA